MEDNYKCPNCGNTNPKYFGRKNGKIYCRLCVAMRAKEIVNKKDVSSYSLVLSYPLTKEQQEVSDKVLENYKNNINTLIYAVTGAGKTELVYHTIEYALKNNLSVGFAIPRKQVVIELATRIKKAYPNNKVISVYGNNHDELEGDIIVLTTHQLYRYQGYFDLLVLDEIDAFPFLDNELLNNMFFKSVRRNYILMSATPNDETLLYFKRRGHDIVYLNKRHHSKPIPVPSLIISRGHAKHMYLIHLVEKMILNGKKVFIFCPTIERAESVYRILSRFINNGNVVHSKIMDQEKIINDFKNGFYHYLVTTAILERGVTVKGLEVIVMDADHEIYNSFSLIQIAGRSGRDHNEPEGEVVFIANRESEEISKSIDTIINYNKSL